MDENNIFSEDIDDLENPEQYNEDHQIVELRAENSEQNTEDREKVKENEPRTHLPLARVKHIMKLDPDLNMVSSEGVFLVARATELFVQSLSREAAVYTQLGNKKTILRRDIDSAIENVDALCFLEETLVNNTNVEKESNKV